MSGKTSHRPDRLMIAVAIVLLSIAGAIIATDVSSTKPAPVRLHNFSIVDALQAKRFDPNWGHTIVSVKPLGDDRVQLMVKMGTQTDSFCQMSNICGEIIPITLKRGPNVHIVRASQAPYSWVLFVYNRADITNVDAKKLRSASLVDDLNFNLDFVNVALTPNLYKEAKPNG